MAPYPFFLPLVSLPEASEGSVIQELLFIILHDAETVWLFAYAIANIAGIG